MQSTAVIQMYGALQNPAVLLLWWPSALIATCVLAAVWVRWRQLNGLSLTIPGPYPRLFLGNLDRFIAIYMSKGKVSPRILIFQYINSLGAVYTDRRMCLIWRAWRPLVGLYKAEHAEVILTEMTAINKSWDYGLLHQWLGSGLLTSSGKKWRSRRKMLTPAFHFRILEDFLPIINEQSRVLVEQLREASQKDWVNIVPLITKYTLDVMCEATMGVQIKAQTNSECSYFKAVHTVGECFVYRNMRPWLWNDRVFSLLPSGRTFKKGVDELHNFTRQVIKERKALLQGKVVEEPKPTLNGDVDIPVKRRKAFLDLLLEYHLYDHSLSEEDIREEVDTFMFEGHDTTAMAISWALHSITSHPEVLRKIEEELECVFGDDKDRPVTMDDLKEMKYLERALKESQRLFPSVPYIGRETEEDIAIDGTVIPKGTTALLSIYMLHRDPEVFPNPEVYDPDRFLPENSIGRHPFAFIPFSAGPRNCIGQRLAMMEEKVVMATIFRNFTMRPLDHRDNIDMVGELVLRPLSGIRMEIRQKS